MDVERKYIGIFNVQAVQMCNNINRGLINSRIDMMGKGDKGNVIDVAFFTKSVEEASNPTRTWERNFWRRGIARVEGITVEVLGKVSWYW